jgi:uncharacterized protein YmfQ (DUF2313 family)
MRTETEYRELLQSLLPPGRAWTKDPTSRLKQLLEGMAVEFSRLDSRVDDLFREKDTRYTSELLEQFEEEYAIPEPGEELGATEADRVAVLRAKFLAIGAQHKQYFIDIAAALGYTVTIQEFTPLWAGYAVAGDLIGEQTILFLWLVVIAISSVTESAEVNISSLISKVSKYKPAHTRVLFEFGGCAFDRSWSIDFNRIPHYDNSWRLGEFSRDFDNSFANAYDYDGVNFTGAFNSAFYLELDRHSGGDYNFDEFSNDFRKPA